MGLSCSSNPFQRSEYRTRTSLWFLQPVSKYLKWNTSVCFPLPTENRKCLWVSPAHFEVSKTEHVFSCSSLFQSVEKRTRLQLLQPVSKCWKKNTTLVPPACTKVLKKEHAFSCSNLFQSVEKRTRLWFFQSVSKCWKKNTPLVAPTCFKVLKKEHDSGSSSLIQSVEKRTRL